MIRQLTTVIADRNGNNKNQQLLMVNGRLHVLKQGSIDQAMANYFRLLHALTHEFSIEVRISGNENAIASTIFLQNYLQFNGTIYGRMEELTQREYQTLKKLDEGKSYKEIGEDFGIGYQSARNIGYSLCKKLHCNKAMEAVAAGRRLNLFA